MAGDFRQTLPIIRRDTRADQVRSCVKSSYLWDHVETLFFFHKHESFSQWRSKSSCIFGKLLQLAEGNALTYSSGFVKLTNVANTVASPQQLVESVFANVERNHTNAQWLHERAILTPKNTDVAKMSKKTFASNSWG